MDHVRPILVMDDDVVIRKMTANILHHLGYSVTTCAIGEEAITHYTTAMENGERFLAVLLDLVIVGGMGGINAARELLRIDPDAKLIVSSAYGEEPAMTEPDRYGFCGCLRKPYRISNLVEVLAKVLGHVQERNELEHVHSEAV